MSAPDILSVAACVFCFSAGLYCLRDIRPSPVHKKMLRMFGALLWFYLAIVYAVALAVVDVYLIRSGILTRTGVIVASSLYILEIYVNRSSNHA